MTDITGCSQKHCPIYGQHWLHWSSTPPTQKQSSKVWCTLHNWVANYCLLLKIMQLRCTEWVNSLNIRDDRRDIYIERVKKSIYHCMGFFPLVAICQVFSFITRLNSNLCTALTTCNAIQYNSIISHAQNTTTLQPNVLVTGLHRLLVTNKGRSALASTKIPRSTANSSVSISNECQSKGLYIRIW